MGDLDTLEGDLIPREWVCGRVQQGFTAAMLPLPEDTHIKRPDLHAHEEGATPTGNLLVQEAQICEMLREHPHPNICEYRGYIPDAEEGWFFGLALKRYERTLKEAFLSEDDLEADSAMRALRSAVAHLHSLGLVHVSH